LRLNTGISGPGVGMAGSIGVAIGIEIRIGIVGSGGG
jgi:hypothetical protein